MAEPTFDRGSFQRRLATRRLGRPLVARAETPSTNDLAWEALAAGATDGTAVVCDAQTQGRGRGSRSWHTSPGAGLALSLILHPGCDRGRAGLVPLVAGLALARAVEELGLVATLRWPNDLLAGDRKLAGILCESRRTAAALDAIVIGVGVNVGQRREDFPAGLREAATSLALEGCPRTREEVAAGFLNALEPLWTELQEGGRDGLLAAWSRRAAHWGRRVTVRTPAGPVSGIARALSPEGGLVLGLDDGGETVVMAGDLDPAGHGVPR